MSRRTAAVVATLIAGCAAGPLVPGAPKDVRGHRLPPREAHEECFAMARGDAVQWRFATDEPVDFAVQYRDGQALVLPLARERVTSDEGRFVALVGARYCLTWESGGKGAALDYTLQLAPARR